jgi:hypothetical protein
MKVYKVFEEMFTYLVLLGLLGTWAYLHIDREVIYPWITNQVTATTTIGKIVSSDYEAVFNDGGTMLSVPMPNTYRVEIQYTYMVNKKPYTGTRYAAKGDEFERIKEVESIVASYSPGADVKVWYNPYFPDYAVLYPHVGVRRLANHLGFLGISIGLLFLTVRSCIRRLREINNEYKQ